MHAHELIGIGFGPSNLALAVALEESANTHAIDACFIERQPHFAWHADMMVDDARMQISFLKDLATLRNPCSRYSFLNYLHQKHRLQDFINLKTFYPSRHEFNDYLSWAAAQFDDLCAYSEDVLEVLPEKSGGEVTALRVRSRHAEHGLRERLTRNLVVSVGGAPNIPEAFAAHRGDARIFHSSRYLRSISQIREPRRVAVIGAGQSATEIFLDLQSRAGAHDVDLVTRARAIKPSDDSPFVNEIFNADYTDYVYSRPERERAELLDEFMNTNYAAPDLELIEKLFDSLYQQKVTGRSDHRFLRHHEVIDVRCDAQGVHLVLRDIGSGRLQSVSYDAVVLATGYIRDQHKDLLAPLAPWLPGMAVERSYKLRAAADFHPAIFLQGSCEATHGLSDTLLSILAIRTEEIRTELMRQPRAAAARGERKAAAVAAP